MSKRNINRKSNIDLQQLDRERKRYNARINYALKQNAGNDEVVSYLAGKKMSKAELEQRAGSYNKKLSKELTSYSPSKDFRVESIKLKQEYDKKLTADYESARDGQHRFKASKLVGNFESKADYHKRVNTAKAFQKEKKKMEQFIETGSSFYIPHQTMSSLKKTVEKFNKERDKMFEQGKTQGEKWASPERVTVEQFIESSTDLEGLRGMIKDYQKFYKNKRSKELVELPNNKYNTKVSKWAYDYLTEGKKVLDEMYKEQYELVEGIEVTYGGGQKSGYSKEMAGMKSGPQTFDPFQYSTEGTDIRESIKQLARQKQPKYFETRTKMVQHNYIDMLERYVNGSEAGKALIDYLKKLPAEDFYRELTSENDIWHLIYELRGSSSDVHGNEVMKKIWNEWFTDVPYPEDESPEELTNLISNYKPNYRYFKE